ncbi:MAG: hypothetical protein WA668_13315, partial [Candidatus Cybelea sp.]
TQAAHSRCGLRYGKALPSRRIGTIIHPSPHRGVYRSNAGINVPSFAEELWHLLHLDRAKAVPQVDGRYKGKPTQLRREDLDRHLMGEITLAFTPLRYTLALFSGLDIDACFKALLPVVRAAALKIGGAELVAAMFCTTGSDEGRGKVLVAFVEPVPACNARKLVRVLCRHVRASEAAQSLESGDLTAYPLARTGGLVRVLGRNPARGGRIETPFSFDGEVGISHVSPLTRGKLAEIVRGARGSVAPWAVRLIDTPWRRTDQGGTHAHFGNLVALAREAIRLYGEAQGKPAYDTWIDTVKAHSFELSQPSQKTRDPRNVLDYSRERAWEYARRKPNSWKPLELRIGKGVPRGVVRVYNALVLFVRDNGLRPSCFGLDYERLAVLVDAPKTTAYRWVQRANEIGVIVIHDRGRYEPGARGDCSVFGLVCEGETKEQAHAAGAASGFSGYRPAVSNITSDHVYGAMEQGK